MAYRVRLPQEEGIQRVFLPSESRRSWDSFRDRAAICGFVPQRTANVKEEFELMQGRETPRFAIGCPCQGEAHEGQTWPKLLP